VRTPETRAASDHLPVVGRVRLPKDGDGQAAGGARRCPRGHGWF